MAYPMVAQQTLVASTSTTQTALPLSIKAKLITELLVNGTALPDILSRHGNLLSIIATGAAIASGGYHFFQRHRENRAKIRLVVFHVLRMLENLPHLQARLHDPHSLIADIDGEVSRMIDVHLSTGEAAEVMKDLKRKVWDCVDEQRALMAKRRRSSAAMDEDGVAVTHAPNVEKGLYGEQDTQKQQWLGDEDRDVTMLDIGGTITYRTPPSRTSLTVPGKPVSTMQATPFSHQSQLCSSSARLSDCKAADSLQSGEDISSPTLAPRYKSPGFSLDYDDDELYSPDSSPTPSARPSRTEKHGTVLMNKKEPLGLHEANTLLGLDAVSDIHRPYEPPVLTKPRNQRPSKTKALKTCGKKYGTWLIPIQEGTSPQVSPADNTTEYRVAETRKYYNNVLIAREKRRTSRIISNENTELEPAQPEQIVTQSRESPGTLTTKSSPKKENGEVDA